MSDASQGPGWWLASDGRWYPPEAWTGPASQATHAPYQGGSTTRQEMHRPMAQRNNGLAVASLVCSIAGVLPFFFGLPCILGIVFGFVARSQIKRSQGTQGGEGLALAGIIVGFCLIGLFVVVVALLAAFGQFDACVGGSGTLNCSSN